MNLTRSYFMAFQELLVFSGAEFEPPFVSKPGVRIIMASGPTEESVVGSGGDDAFIRSGEFKARLCYLAFPAEGLSTDAAAAEGYVQKLIDRGHLSVWNAFYVEFLVCGIATETMIELLAHTEAKTSRLTTSKTKAQTDTFYRVFGTPEQVDLQKAAIRAWMDKREELKQQPLTVEQRNMLNLGTKCGALTFCMSLKDYRRFLAGRCCVEGNETEIREVALEMLRQLHARYPLMFEALARQYSVIDE